MPGSRCFMPRSRCMLHARIPLHAPSRVPLTKGLPIFNDNLDMDAAAAAAAYVISTDLIFGVDVTVRGLDRWRRRRRHHHHHHGHHHHHHHHHGHGHGHGHGHHKRGGARRTPPHVRQLLGWLRWVLCTDHGRSAMLDGVGSIPFDLLGLVAGGGVQACGVLRLNRLMRAKRALGLLWRLEAGLVVSGHLFGILLLIAQMAILSHWLGCAWFFIGTHPSGNEWTWILARILKESGEDYDVTYPPNATLSEGLDRVELPGTWRTWWLRSLYWTTTTMTTTGYGDVIPLSDVEIGYTILVCLVGHVIFAYLFGTIATSFSQLDVSAQMFRRRLSMFQHFVSHRR